MRKDAEEESHADEIPHAIPEIHGVCNSRKITRATGHRLSHNQLSKSLPEQLMAGMNAEHDVVMSMRLDEIRNHKYPESRGLPPPAKFAKAKSSHARFARSCSADEMLMSMESHSHGSCCYRRNVRNYDFDQAELFFPCSLFSFIV
jgi:hypothetical protein